MTPTAAMGSLQLEHPVSDRAKPSFVMGTLALRAERQSVQMSKITITIASLTHKMSAVCNSCLLLRRDSKESDYYVERAIGSLI